MKVTENVAPAISVLFIPNFHLVSCHMEHNYLPLYLNNSRTYITDNQFVCNKGSLGGAIAAYDSTVMFLGQNLFLGNEAEVGGGVFANRSVLVITGSTAFINNTAEYGGGIGADNSSLLYGDLSNKSSSCNRTHTSNIFIQNLAQSGGGGMWLISSVLQQIRGNLNFTMNQAGSEGGGIFSDSSLIRLDGYVVLERNYAKLYGGGIEATDSTLRSSGEIGFVSNEAWINGGGVHLWNSTLILRGNGSYINNTAGGSGGVINAIHDSNVVLDGENTMRWNSATYEGGAVSVVRSTLTITGISDFVENWANHGGALYAETSNLIFGGVNSFISNVATHDLGYGGTIDVVMTLVTLNGTHNLTNNRARYGGGLAIEAYETLDRIGSILMLTPNATVAFFGNYAQEYGGAIYVEDFRDHYCFPDARLLKSCFFTFSDLLDGRIFWLPLLNRCSQTDKYTNECLGHIIIEGNFAEDGGDAIYGGNLHNCIVELSTEHSCKYIHGGDQVCYMSGFVAVAALTRTSVEQLTKDPFNVVSYTYKVCACDSHKPNCKQRTINHTAYPGETVSIPQKDHVKTQEYLFPSKYTFSHVRLVLPCHSLGHVGVKGDYRSTQAVVTSAVEPSPATANFG